MTPWTRVDLRALATALESDSGSFFHGVRVRDLHELLGESVEERWPDGTALLEVGVRVDDAFLLLEGRFEIFPAFGAPRTVVARAETNLTGAALRTAPSARVMVHTHLGAPPLGLRIRGQAFRDLVERTPELGVRGWRRLAEYLASAEETIEALSSEGLERVAWGLQLAAGYGANEPSANRREWDWGVVEVAKLVRSDKSTVSRVLKKLEQPALLRKDPIIKQLGMTVTRPLVSRPRNGKLVIDDWAAFTAFVDELKSRIRARRRNS